MSVDFPGPSARKFDWDHIFERHSDQGAMALQSSSKTIFSGLTQGQIKARVRSAWRRRSLRKSQRTVSGVERLFYRGVDPKSGEVVMFWYNVKTKIVETAYPMRS